MDLAHSYGVPLSAAVVLRPDYVATLTRGVARVGGSLIGVGLIGFLVAWLHPGTGGTVILVALTGWGAYTFVQSNYGIGVVFLAGLVLLLVGVGQADTVAVAGDRLLDSVLGGSVALSTYLMWPTWSKDEARQSLALLVGAQRRYVIAVLDDLTGGEVGNPQSLRDLGRTARLAYSTAQSAVGRSLSEPSGRRIDSELSQGLLAALRRLVRAAHSLRTEDSIPSGPTDLAECTRAIDRSYALIAQGLTHSPPLSSLPPLRSLYHHLREAGDLSLPVMVQLDEMVDAIDTAGQLIGV